MAAIALINALKDAPPDKIESMVSQYALPYHMRRSTHCIRRKAIKSHHYADFPEFPAVLTINGSTGKPVLQKKHPLAGRTHLFIQ